MRKQQVDALAAIALEAGRLGAESVQRAAFLPGFSFSFPRSGAWMVSERALSMPLQENLDSLHEFMDRFTRVDRKLTYARPRG